jgi:hypothetical protein
LAKYYLRATGERFQEESLEPPVFEKNCLTMEIVILLKMNKFVYLRKSRRTRESEKHQAQERTVFMKVNNALIPPFPGILLFLERTRGRI